MIEIPVESSLHENKETFDEKRPINVLKTVCAFANTNTGSIYIGVNNKREVVGVNDIENKINKISSFIKDRIKPIPKFEIKTQVIENKTVIILVVEKGTETPYFLTEQSGMNAYIRYGDQTHKASRDEILTLTLEGKNLSYDGLLTDIPWENATFNILNNYFREKGIRVIEDYNDLVSLELAKNNVLTNAGALLADNSFVKNSLVFATNWKGLEKSNDNKNKDLRNFSGNILEILKNSMQFIMNNSHIDFKKIETERLEFPDYPELAVREALVNALVHRDYSNYYDQININMYTNRLEISSPGGMIDRTKVQDLDPYKIGSKRRNPILANIFSLLKLMERRGTGIKEILNIYSRQENYSLNHRPEFTSDDKSFVVTLKNLNYENQNNETFRTSDNTRSNTEDQIRIVLEFAQKTYKFKRIDIDNLLNVSPSRSRVILNELVENNKLVTIGSFKDKEYIFNKK
ncbi:ATP-binding protein [Mycoplasma sp. HU2014]|uniref:ATP-binding protein n=1 Tax=Mycoplasma sp. HU2014 TaxID=1664275 RepID=UPI00067B8FE0|nr:RNA-binding domain-containing protein [Mycoplasma sp. HU2014]KNG79058.1 ATPase AAA [Mycoplasma sp. HU2014]